MKLAEQFLYTLLIRYSSKNGLEYLLYGNSQCDRIEMGILDAGRLLKFGASFRLTGDQLWARAKGREVPSDSARLVQLESVFLLNYKE